MRHFRFYHLESGELHQILFSTDDLAAVVPNTPLGHKAIEGEFDRLAQKVDIETGEVIDYQPPQPSSDHEWNAETKRWQLAAAAKERIARRAAALARIAVLQESQHRYLRQHALGVASALEHLRAIDDEITSLTALKSNSSPSP